MLYLVGLFAVITLLFIGASVWIRWFQVFDGPDGERYRRRATQGPYAAQVDVDDDPRDRHPRPDPRDQDRGGRPSQTHPGIRRGRA